ncbi:ankyrin [Rhizodiscina lignyota]|uniref:Ankyrin n=1 Tax=Rhizodiscina lignyota TaxID=1504668 RepID=A0A9P4IBP4_9PEZI|nr:ankyrin [Rhizodiscina lignyota]
MKHEKLAGELQRYPHLFHLLSQLSTNPIVATISKRSSMQPSTQMHGSMGQCGNCKICKPYYNPVSFQYLTFPVGFSSLKDLIGSDLGSLIHISAIHGDPELFKLLVTGTNVDINARTPFGETALGLAALYGHHALVQLLADRADTDMNLGITTGGTNTAPLTIAVNRRYEGVVTVFAKDLRVNANIRDTSGKTPLCQAIHQGDENIAIILLHHEMILADDISVDERAHELPLRLAARRGLHHVVNALIARHDVDVNKKSGLEKSSALHAAATVGQNRIIEMLLKHPDIDVNSVDMRDQTPLAAAIKNGDLDTIQILLDQRKWRCAEFAARITRGFL